MSLEAAIPSELSKQNPWPGLRAFGENDRDFFFGRERESVELFGLVQRAPVVVLYGQSGLGKTSLLQAGLFPKLKTLDFFPVRVRFDHGDDAPPLARQITSAVSDELDRLQVKGPRPAPTETLWEYFHRRDVDYWGLRNRLLTPVIVLDQFEEVFTLGHRSEKSNARVAEFQKELEAVLEHRPPDAVRERFDANPDEASNYDLKKQAVKFVITLREDFLADLDPWRVRMPSLLPNRFRLERMTGEQALEVVQRAGSDVVDPSVARDIVDFVSTSRLKRSSTALETRDVDPALLSVVCDGLNFSRISRGKQRITADLLTAEREEIMKDFYERTFEGIDPRVRDWVEDRLLTSSGYRDRAALDDATKLGLPAADFDVLVNRRLLHREERSGVMWLEFTHDSLTDPASRSRAVREQRVQADAAKEREKAAAAREAQVRSQLRRSQLLVGSFGLLLVASLIGSYEVWKLYHQIRKQDEALVAAQAKMVEEKKRADAREDELHTVREKNEENFKKQVSAADSLFDMRVPTATVINIIQITDNSFITLSSEHSSSNDIDLPHARFLAQAAGALYQVGHYDEGLTYANRAMDLVRGNVKPGDSQDHLTATRAEALYAHASGLLATGGIGEARQNFEEAIKLSSGNTDTDSKQDMERIFALSHIGLGEVAFDGYQYGEARHHYEAALDFVKRSKANDDEHLYWQVLALRGMWLSQPDDEKAQPYIAQANDVVGSLMKHDPGNIRWKSLSTDIYYSQGFTYLRLEQYDAAQNLFEQANATAEELCKRDSENREWRLSLARVQRAMALVHFDQGELVVAEKLLKQADEPVRDLSAQQPSWMRAAQVHGLLLMVTADVKESRHSQSADAAYDLNAVFELYSQSRAVFQRSRASAPSVLFFDDDVALAAVRQGYLRSLQADDARRKPASDKPAQDLAIQRDREALDFYSQAFSALAPLEHHAAEDPAIVQEKADIYQRIGYVERALKEMPKAITAFQNAVTTTTTLVKLAPTAANYGRLDVARSSLGDAYEESNDTSRAFSEYAAAMDALGKAMALRKDDTELIRKKAVVQSRISDVWYDKDNLENALNELEKAFATVWTALQYDYSGETLNSNLKFYQERLARIRKRLTDKSGNGSQPLNLTPEASQALLRRIDALAEKNDASKLLDRNEKRANWSLRPLMPGRWRILTSTELNSAIQQLLAIDKNVTQDQVHGIRKMPLDFYDEAALYESEVKLADGEEGIVAFVQRGTEWVLLDGTNAPILRMNGAVAPKLDRPDLALEYLRFYVESLNVADYGRLRLIDHAADVDWMPTASSEARGSVGAKLKPLILESSSDKEWQAIGTMQIGDTIWEASFHLARNGGVVMQQSRQIENEWPIYLDEISKGVRIQRTMASLNEDKPQRDLAALQKTLAANPKDEDALKKIPGLYYEMKRWKDAIEAEKNWLAYVKAEPDSVANKSITLHDAVVGLAWYQLFARDFAGALASSEEAMKLDPSRLTGEEERAFALLYLGRVQAAEDIFLANGGKKMDSKSTLIWEDSVAGDYNVLKKEGITHPDAERIGELMTRQQNQRNLTQDEQTLKANPNDEKALRRLPYLYYKSKQWKQAIETEQRFVTLLQGQPDATANKKDNLRDAYDVLSWYQLFTRDFVGALKSSEEARKLDPTHLYNESQRAHALLFLGRTREAEVIYLENIGKKVEAKSDQTWEQSVLSDFTTLEDEGISNSEVPRIRTLLRRPENERLLAQYLGQLKKDANDEPATRRLPTVYFNLGRWKDAVEGEKTYIAFLQRQTKHDADWTDALSGAYVGLAWYQLFTRDFAASLASSDEALKLNPKNLPAQTNRAHALLFLGRTQEAEAIYLQHRGEKVFAGSDEKWEEAILTDFDDLGRAGITHAEFDRLRGLLKAPPK